MSLTQNRGCFGQSTYPRDGADGLIEQPEQTALAHGLDDQAVAVLAHEHLIARELEVHWRGALSIVGPLIVLAGLYPVWMLDIGWGRAVFYTGLAIMVAVSLVDLIKPPGGVQCPTSSSVPS